MALAGEKSHACNILSTEHVSSDNPKWLDSFNRHDFTDFPCKYLFRPVLNKLYEECKVFALLSLLQGNRACQNRTIY